MMDENNLSTNPRTFVKSGYRHWIWLLLLFPVVFGLRRLHLDVEILNLLPADSRVVQGLKLYQENFSNARELIITVESTDAEVTEQTALKLAEALRHQTDQIVQRCVFPRRRAGKRQALLVQGRQGRVASAQGRNPSRLH